MKTNRLVLVLASTFLLAVAMPASADVYTFNTIQRGFYDANNFNDPGNENYIVGQQSIQIPLDDSVLTAFQQIHDFFAFAPLGVLNGPIVSIDLILFNPDAGYTSTQASENLSVAGFGGNVASLIAGTDATGYADLASGTVYGTKSVSTADNNTYLDISLNVAAIAAIGSASGNFAIGGQLTGIPAADQTSRFLFGGTPFADPGDGATYLKVVTAPTSEVPEPGSMLLFATGIGATLLLRRKGISEA